jgi:uncharacterized repeat protein (TIGR01451 family)
MKKNIFIYVVYFITLLSAGKIFAQPQANCFLRGNQYPVNASLVSATGAPLDSIESGKDFNLNITLPGMGSQSCSGYSVQIQTSNNLTLGNQPASTVFPFVQCNSTPLTFCNVSPIPSINGYGLNVPFHFLPGTTCNAELGTFKVIIKNICGNQTDSCVLNVSLKAIAKNYWIVTKQRVWGNLFGGYVLWRVKLINTNPNPGIGDLDIYSGNIIDQISGSNTIVSVSTAATGIGTNTATWSTGTISSYTSAVWYDVVTQICSQPGTVVKNCVNYSFCLGKKVSNNPTTGSGFAGHNLTNPVGQCCASAFGNVCDSVTIVGQPNYAICFGKTRPSAANINWAQGCEGFYDIDACGNCGSNVPLDSLKITDVFPSGIQVTAISLLSNSSGPLPPINGTLTAGSTTINYIGSNVLQTYYFSTPPSSFTFTSTPGQLIYNQCIKIRVKFVITAPAGTLITNCANITYTNGRMPQNANKCGFVFPETHYNGSATACDTFYVRQPKAIPFIKKCISNGQQSFNVGDVIPFTIVVANHGQAPLGTVNVQDFLGSPQNLQLVPGSIQYSYGMGYFDVNNPLPWCSPPITNPINSQPSWLNYTGNNTQNLSWNINGMPGNCQLDSAYYLVIQFNATVLPQSFGNYSNTTTLTGSGFNISSYVPYNVMRLAKIDVTKKVSVNGQIGTSGFVNPGQNFQYQISVCNVGSVGLKNLSVQDVLPNCVQLQPGCSGYLINSQGQQQTISGISCAAPNFVFPPSTVIQPGDCAVLVINVQRKAQDTSKQCCNLKAVGKGTTTDAVAQTIQDEDGPVCVKSSLCCEIERMNAVLQPTGNTATLANFNLNVQAGNLPIQELTVTLTDFHVQYNYNDCKPQQMGDYMMHLTSSLTNLSGTSGQLILQNPTPPFVNNMLTWQLGTPTMIGAGVNIPISLVMPNMLQIPCCTGRVYFCLKVTVKDVDCRVCEKTVCGYFDLPKQVTNGASNSKLMILQDLNNQKKQTPNLPKQ